MTIFEAVVLGLIQGVFMFVPVSSTSHLALAQHVMSYFGSEMPPPDSPEMILFDVVVHVGTLVSIVVVMWAGLSRLVRGIGTDLWDLLPERVRLRGGRHRRRWRGNPAPVTGQRMYLRLGWLALLTVFVTGVLGLAIRAVGTEVFATPWLIAAALMLTGIILWWTDTAGPQWRGVGQLSVWVAVAIGAAQAAALLPGLSRSGLTIAMALLLGLYRPLAAQYSFFIAIPTILSIMAVQLADVWRAQDGAFEIGLPAYAAGFVVAAVIGALALALVLKLLYQAKFRYFAIYVWLIAIVVLIYGLD